MVAETAVCAARDCENEFTPNTTWHRYCTITCRDRERQRTPEYRKHNRERMRECRLDPKSPECQRYWNLSGVEYNKLLLRSRRRKALKRMEERNLRLEVERLG